MVSRVSQAQVIVAIPNNMETGSDITKLFVAFIPLETGASCLLLHFELYLCNRGQKHYLPK